MTPALKASAGYWIFGTAIAFAGVVISRVVAAGFEGRVHAMLALTGQLVAFGGLLIILLGIRRRLRRAHSDTLSLDS